MEATGVNELTKPTMQLNLGGHTSDLQESLVVHEFGHALGLNHEYLLEEPLDAEKMQKDPLACATFDEQSAKKASTGSEEPLAKSLLYGPESIMYYK